MSLFVRRLFTWSSWLSRIKPGISLANSMMFCIIAVSFSEQSSHKAPWPIFLYCNMRDMSCAQRRRGWRDNTYRCDRLLVSGATGGPFGGYLPVVSGTFHAPHPILNWCLHALRPVSWWALRWCRLRLCGGAKDERINFYRYVHLIGCVNYFYRNIWTNCQ